MGHMSVIAEHHLALVIALISIAQQSIWCRCAVHAIGSKCKHWMSLQATSSSKAEEAHPEEALKPTPKLQSTGGGASGGRPEPAPSSTAPAKGFVEQMPDMTLLQCCTSANFWLLFLTCSIGGRKAA